MAFDVQAALTYDQKQGYTQEQIQTIQRVTGSESDGAWTPDTVNAVAAWQARVGLSADGKVGPGTWKAIQRFAAVEAKQGAGERAPKLGVWLDDVPSTVLASGWLTKLRSLGFSTIAVMVQRSTSGKGADAWSLRWSANDLTKLRELAKPLGFDIVLTTWPLPDSAQLAAIAKDMPGLLASAGASGFEVDTEGNWKPERVSGFASLSDAAKALVDVMRSSAAATKARLELTTYPYHGENSSKAEVAPHMDCLFPQAYSVSDRGGTTIPWDDALGPGTLQATSVHRAEAIEGVPSGKVELGLGLAGYEQNFAGHTIAQALQAALDAAALQRIPEVRYWSSRWILGSSSSKQPQVAEFFAARAKLAEVPRGGAPADVDADADAIEAERAQHQS